jgi:hypothetical protein
LADAIYETPWHNSNPQMKRDLIFMILRFQKPATVGSSFFKLNRESLADVSFSGF